MNDNDFELEDERTAERRYAKKLRDERLRVPIQNGPGTRSDQLRTPIGELYGRVALSGPDDDLLDGRSDFYIGETYADVDGNYVFGWTNPIACTFFRGSDHHELCDEVAVIRTFGRRAGQIVEYTDEVVRAVASTEPFKKRGLSIPKPPPGRSFSLPWRSRSRRRVEAVPPQADDLSASTIELSADPGLDRKLRPMRAMSLLQAQLQAPRTKVLNSVLATLQPDQYELVTLAAMESVVIEGQPGTGKTIVASHRAAYLIDNDTPGHKALDGNVLIVGPTVGYSNHIRGVVKQLTGDSKRVKILSLPELMDRIVPQQQVPAGPSARDWQDMDWQLGALAQKAIVRLRAERRGPLTAEKTYEFLRRNGRSTSPLTTDPDWTNYLKCLPPFRNALKWRAHSPLLAVLRWGVAPPAELKSIEHIIVDEAQDVTPLEWMMLRSMNEAKMWTILGDLNQRRSDFTLPSWSNVLDMVRLDDATPIRVLECGYRSTRPILEFANCLLPRGNRGSYALQNEGPQPVVEKFSPPDLAVGVVSHINRLTVAYPQGTVAVIGTDPKPVRERLQSAGWSMSRTGQHVWEKDGRTVTVTHPDAARGLEFDAVIVVEPAGFPQNLGRLGALYTALTRANREVAVVHARPLPSALRRS